MYCFYSDHSSYKDEQKLAEVSLCHKKGLFLNPELGLSLLTCHRVEYYITKTLPLNFINLLPYNHQRIDNNLESIKRIVRIAIGLESKIIGEKAIYHQVKQSIDNYLKYSPNDNIFTNLINVAKECREKFEFFAPAHGELIYDHICRFRTHTIILIGAGMLNQTIVKINSESKKYEKVILVTRDIKKAKKRLRDYINAITVIKPEMLNNLPINEKFDLVIATDNVNSEYETEITKLSKLNNCKHIVDVSSVPIKSLVSEANQYYSLYSKNTETLVKKSNKIMKQKIIFINNYLESYFKKYE